MPIYQSIGIILAAFTAILGLPRLLIEQTAAARLEKRLEIVQRVLDKSPADDAKDRIVEHTVQLVRRLAATYEIQPSKRDSLWVLVGIVGPIAMVVAVQLVDLRLPPSRDPVVTQLSNLTWALSFLVVVNAYVRVRTLSRNRRLYIALACPKDRPVLHVPPFRAALGGRVTVDVVMERANAAFEADEESSLAEHARKAARDLERQYYGARWARKHAG
ncbi:MAG: hypothetical protein LLG14_18035 [Nocardiaceae bacterium]|nr:hypothetical protein [Nocardiaceae bacterium]